MNVSPKVMLAVLCALFATAIVVLYPNFLGDGKSGDGPQAANKCTVSPDIRERVGKAAIGDVAAFNLVDEPTQIPAFTFNDDAGKLRSLDDWSGRTVLLNLWATWCAPCRKEMPDLQKLDAELGSEKFDVVAVSVDQGGPQKPKEFYASIGLDTLGFYHDGSVDALFNLKKEGLAFGLPATLLIHGNGCVIGTLNGPAEWGGEDAQALVKAALD